MGYIERDLLAKGYRVLLIEYDSSLNYFDMQQQVNNQISALDEDPNLIIGHSMGGIIANDLYGDHIPTIALDSSTVEHTRKENTIVIDNRNSLFTNPLTWLTKTNKAKDLFNAIKERDMNIFLHHSKESLYDQVDLPYVLLPYIRNPSDYGEDDVFGD